MDYEYYKKIYDDIDKVKDTIKAYKLCHEFSTKLEKDNIYKSSKKLHRLYLGNLINIYFLARFGASDLEEEYLDRALNESEEYLNENFFDLEMIKIYLDTAMLGLRYGLIYGHLLDLEKFKTPEIENEVIRLWGRYSDILWSDGFITRQEYSYVIDRHNETYPDDIIIK